MRNLALLNLIKRSEDFRSLSSFVKCHSPEELWWVTVPPPVIKEFVGELSEKCNLPLVAEDFEQDFTDTIDPLNVIFMRSKLLIYSPNYARALVVAHSQNDVEKVRLYYFNKDADRVKRSLKKGNLSACEFCFLASASIVVWLILRLLSPKLTEKIELGNYNRYLRLEGTDKRWWTFRDGKLVLTKKDVEEIRLLSLWESI